MDLSIGDALPFGKYFQFTISIVKKAVSKGAGARNILMEMMTASKQDKLPPKISEPKTRKEEMYNALIEKLSALKLGWSGYGIDGKKFIENLRDVLWKVKLRYNYT